MKYCKTCNVSFADTQNFCTTCGGGLETWPWVCSRCQSTLTQGAAFCTNCGAPSNSNAVEQTITEKPVVSIAVINSGICPQCGTEVEKDDVFCYQCGFDMVNKKENEGKIYYRKLSTWEKIKTGGNVISIFIMLFLDLLLFLMVLFVIVAKISGIDMN